MQPEQTSRTAKLPVGTRAEAHYPRNRIPMVIRAEPSTRPARITACVLNILDGMAALRELDRIQMLAVHTEPPNLYSLKEN